MKPQLDIVIIGLSITSSWGNGHATTYRALVRELENRGHNVLFLEHDKPWYADNRDLPNPPYGETKLYSSFRELKNNYQPTIANADAVIVGSYVPQGIEVGEWVIKEARGVTAFYDIDTPVTLARMKRNDCDYLHPDLIPKYNLYLSFTGGPVLEQLENIYGSPKALPLYCSVDPALYFPKDIPKKWDLGYLGTYSSDRQPPLKNLMLDAADQWPAGRFVVAGPSYPSDIDWPRNVDRIQHIPPAEHCEFYNSQKFTLNVTRKDMVELGYAPSVRLFEAAACGTPIISDHWEGLDTFFEFDTEILISRSAEDSLKYLKELSSIEREEIGERARKKVMNNHTAAHRAKELEGYLMAIAQPATL